MNGLGHSLAKNRLSELIGKSVFVAMFEVDERCRLVLSQSLGLGTWLSDKKDKSGLTGSVFWLVEGGLRLLLERFINIKGVLVVGGSPCVGFSAANPSRPGAASSESAKIWIFSVLAHQIRASGISVDWVVENVSMEPSHEQGVSRLFSCKPQSLDNSLVNPCSRPRLFWHNQPLHELSGPRKSALSVLDKGWVPLWAFEDHSLVDSKVFGTFLRPFPPGKPWECKDVSFWRLPLSSYSRTGLVVRKVLSPSDTAIVAGWIRSSVDISTRDLKKAGSPALLSRLALASWVHLEGGSRFLRPLFAHERELCLGFPSGAGAISTESILDSAFQWERMQMSGNSFSPDIISHVLGPWCRSVLDGSTPHRRPHFPAASTESEAMSFLLPSGNSHR